jgi:hypothetical protein
VDGSVVMTGTDINIDMNDATGIWIGDIDSDGSRDVVAVANTGNKINWYEGTDTPTAVEAHSFTAQPATDGTGLSWRTATEVRTLGFNVYASDSPLSDSWSLLTLSPIPALRPGDLTGDSYRWTDSSLSLSSSRCYFLEALLVGGGSNGYGPPALPFHP